MDKISRIYYEKFYLLFTLILFFVSTVRVQGQIFPSMSVDTTESSVVEWPEDTLGRRTPRGTVNGFIRAVADQDYVIAAHYLNMKPALRQSEQGASLAKTLRRLLDQSGYIIPYSRISNEPTGEAEEGERAGIEKVGAITANEANFDLIVEVTEGPDGGPIWLFSAETVENLSSVSVDHQYPLLDRILPEFLKSNKWMGVAIGEWISIFLLAFISWLVGWVFTKTMLFFISRFWQKARTEPTAGILKAFALPIRLYIALWFFVVFSVEIGISIVLRQRISSIPLIIGLVAFLILLWRLADFISRFSEKRLTLKGHISGVSAVLFLRRVAKIIIIVIGLIAILGVLGVDVTTGLAALGIGGIALALGAQKTVENFVGSVSLIADQPIRVGDFCKVGDTIGTVEQIGMRSTRIRTLNRTVVTIPNGDFSSQKIENYTHRDRFLFTTVFGFRYETTPDQMRYLLVELRSILYAHPKVSPEPARIRFIELGSDSLNIEVFAYILGKDFNEFLEVKEDLLLRMMDVVEASGTGFAFPSQTIYLAKDTGLSAEKTEEAEKKVNQWRANGEMSIPYFDEDMIQVLRNSILYPPEGSSYQDNTKR